MAFKPEGFSEQIFKQRYAFNENETWEEACDRVAKQMAIAESQDKVEKYQERFKEVLINNYFCPGGRIWYGSGRPHPNMLNCFVLSKDLDSREGWGNVAKEMIVTSMAGGGCGVDFSDVRPRGAEINGQKGSAPGAVELMKLINNCGDPIRAGGARRVALMFSLDVDHPDIEEFLSAKLTEGALSMANCSVRINDMADFIERIRTDKPLELSWKGKYKSSVSAKLLWDVIVQNAWNKAEPGILNRDLMNSENTIFYREDIVTTNPCGEVNLTPHESCCLGHLVLPRFVKGNGVNWELLGNTVRTGVRFLDNVLTVNNFPMPEMKEKAEKYRRIGLGTTGLADFLVRLGYRYGSIESNQFIDKFYRFISKQAYEASIVLAAEKGPFPACKPDLHVKSGYVKRLTPKIKDLIKEHGIRNCALLTQAPTGTVSILSGNVSSGIEPIMAPAYERKYWVGDDKKTEVVFHPLFVECMKANKDLDHFVAAHELSVRDHMEVQRIIQKHVDNAVSKTINLPKEYPIEDMSDIWLTYLPHLKGTTFYRDGSRGEAPITPFSLEKAIDLYEKSDNIKEGAEEQKCKGGMCEL